MTVECMCKPCIEQADQSPRLDAIGYYDVFFDDCCAECGKKTKVYRVDIVHRRKEAGAAWHL
ncbi:MAG: hypothetical protein KJN60_11705 [Boseongicola sp.]|nr:hypothetical protein [Boseongicola sp.]